jgi:ABC-type Zn uptake system ZnuABC Zn-binding protein ZnuA
LVTASVSVAQEPVKVLATYSILGDFVQNVGGDLIDLTVLVGRDGDAHEYEPTPQDSVALANADLIFENGLAFETWLDDLYSASGSAATRVVVSEGLTPRAMQELGEHAGEEHAHEEVEVSDLSPWAGGYNITTLTSELFTSEKMQPVFAAILESTPELSIEQIESSYGAMANTSFEGMTFEGNAVTFTIGADTTGAESVTCDYTFVRTEELADFPGNSWHLFEGSEDCGEYRYFVAGLPHAPEPGATPHFHFRYSAKSFEDITTNAEVKNWYPSAYPVDTTPESIVEGDQTNARGLGTFLASVVGVEIALTEEEQMAQATPDDHEHGEFDPHIWHNPQNVMVMVDNIAAALIAADPTNEASYLANATTYKAELEQLDSYMQSEVDKLPAEQRKLVTSHDALGYFADRFGFEVIGAVISSVSTESSDANAGELAELVDTVKASSVPAIFVENITNTELVEQVAMSAGVKVAPALYTDALGPEDSEGATYLEMMRYNVDTVVTALTQ